MRSPFHKVYREFPQLDRFDNKQCKKIVQQAWAASGIATKAKYVAAVLAMSVVIQFLALLLFLGIYSVLSVTTFQSLSSDDLKLAIGVVIGIVTYSSIAVIFFGYFDQWYSRRILSRYFGVECRRCGFSLRSLPRTVNDDLVTFKVRCPECGTEQSAPTNEIEAMGEPSR